METVRELKDCEQEYHAFTDLVRKLCLPIITAAMTGKSDTAAELALSLSDLAADRKRELENRQAERG